MYRRPWLLVLDFRSLIFAPLDLQPLRLRLQLVRNPHCGSRHTLADEFSGLIYLIIISFFSFTFFLPIHMKFMQKSPPTLKMYQLVLWRYLSTLVAYLIMSLAYSFLSLAFQIPFSNDPAPETSLAQNANLFGKASFVVFWMLNFGSYKSPPL